MTIATAETAETADPQAAESAKPFFILYLGEPEFSTELNLLTQWVHGLLLPAYGEEVTTTLPWCPQWWQHVTAIAQLHGLWLAWQHLTGPKADLIGPATWHRDFLAPAMNTLRSPNGPFAGCKPGSHRPKETPPIQSPEPLEL
ncbi:DUF4913 domain-containing protein [Actinoplanes sp. NPDC051494]|uniref:DUF4913 domain-containing protein n=1 Tax=Actinoplanes sp. NPDC051494 TaxID=3363907 RepID=UPI003797C846